MQWAVLLAGGSGSRFWPLSSPSRPKHLLPLAGQTSSAAETFARLDGLIAPERILVVAGAQLAGQLKGSIPVPDTNVLVEPEARSTGPALAWGSFEALRRDPDAIVLSMHTDWHVPDRAAFARVGRTALELSDRHDVLVTVGVVPTRPETGYGYIVPGEPLDGTGRRVGRFVEKPKEAEARVLIEQGALWNSGLFAWKASMALAEIRRVTPEIADALPSLERGDVAGYFRAAEPVSIDVGLLERSDRVAVVAGDFRWDDIGTWNALARVRPTDQNGNVIVGNATLVDSRDCIVWSEETPIVVSGVDNLVVVAANGRILVLDRGRAADLKQTLDVLPPAIRELPT
ncbi:MAG: sugar phosphate nucleotidyltransferase [Gemmatimonadota bacterium]